MTTLVIALALICLMLGLMVWRLFTLCLAARREIDHPDRLPGMLRAIVRRVERDGDWGTLERMRDDVRRALRDLDRLRHDTSQQKLRNSKATSSPR